LRRRDLAKLLSIEPDQHEYCSAEPLATGLHSAARDSRSPAKHSRRRAFGICARPLL